MYTYTYTYRVNPNPKPNPITPAGPCARDHAFHLLGAGEHMYNYTTLYFIRSG